MAAFLKLEDVGETAKLRPETFFIPSKEERQSQKIGDSVRLHFLLDSPGENEPRAERIWVTVTQEQSFLRPYKGTLQTGPLYIQGLNLGDEVTFKSCHIAMTIIKKGDPRWIDCGELKALVSKMCLEEGNAVRFLYREKADRKEDSGWRMFAGNETEEYTSDPKNTRVMNVGYLLDLDPTLLTPLKEGIGAVFERKSKDAPWEKVVDWNPAS